MIVCMDLLNFFSGVEKNNDIARSIVLRKSNNWDSPASILQAEHRMTQLCKRERKKRKYAKHDEEFWVKGKQELMRKKRKVCISVQQQVESDLQSRTSSETVTAEPKSKRGCKRGRRRGRSLTQAKKITCNNYT